LLKEQEYKISLFLVPTSYDYSDDEIVYRIYIENQLISERSLPFLNSSQALLDTFIIRTANKKIQIFVENLSDNILYCNKIAVNDVNFSIRSGSLITKDFSIFFNIGKKINKSEVNLQ